MDPGFFRWIQACIESLWIAPLVNGRAAYFLQASKGLRQGCLISPLLYDIQASVLIFQLERCRLQQDLMGIRKTRGVKDINHVQFVVDTLLLGRVSTFTVRSFKMELGYYKESSSSQINYMKIQM